MFFTNTRVAFRYYIITHRMAPNIFWRSRAAFLSTSKGSNYLTTDPSVPFLDNIKFSRSFATKNSDPAKKMVDLKHVASYEDVLKVIDKPEKVLIDVRNPDEISVTGKIPSSINIPLGNVPHALSSMSEEEFKTQYHRTKPTPSDELIFYCQSGKRSTEALEKALQLGFSNSKTYLGSWKDWSSKHQ